MRSWPALVASGLDAGNLSSGVHLPADHEPETDSSRADLLQAALTDFSVAAIDEPSHGTLRAFFHDRAERDRAVTALRADFPDLEITPLDVPDEDWATRSQANLKAVQVGDLVVTPPWDAGAARKAGTTTVVIQPSMGFGTGHHATTRLCLAALQRAHVRGRSVLDVGTGSGVLAIAASLLGAAPVVGIDDDADAIQSARENLESNAGASVDLRVGDLRSSTLEPADVVLANLTGTLLTQTAPLLEALVAPAGRLIVSGLMDHEEAPVTAAFSDLALLDRTQEDEWVCLVLAPRGVFQ